MSQMEQKTSRSSVTGMDRFRSAARFFLLAATVLMLVLFAALNPSFLSARNVASILRTASILGITAIGLMMVCATGGINFAVSSQITLAGAVMGLVMKGAPEGMLPLAILAALAAVGITGFISGVLVIQCGVPPFIATLSVQTAVMGISRRLCGNTTMQSSAWPSNFRWLGQGMIGKWIPVPLMLFLVIGIIFWFFFNKTRTGRYIFAVGSNELTCKQVGINVKVIKYIAYTLGSMVVAFGGVVLASQSNSVVLTAGMELWPQVICVCMLSATFLTIGKYNVPGAAVAAVMMVVAQNGVVGLGGSFYMKDIIQGVIFVISVSIIALVRKEGLPKVSFGV